MPDLQFAIRLTADASGFVGTVNLVSREVEKLGLASEKTARKIDEKAAAMQRGRTSAIALGNAIGMYANQAITALTRWAVAGIQAGDAIKDMADVTGSSVESLSHLVNVAKIGGAGLDQLTLGLERLSIGLSGTDEESKKSGKALHALGISARDPAEAMKELAQKFSQYKDDANKAAWANEIFGKGGARLLPMLKDLAEAEGNLASVTKEQALQAEKLSDDWRKLAVDAGRVRDGILRDVVPALIELIAQLNDGTKYFGSFWAAMWKIGTSNPFKSTVEQIADVERRLKDLSESPMGPGGFQSAEVAAQRAQQLAKLRQELEYWKAQQRREALNWAASLGDTSDQASRAAGRKESLGGLPDASKVREFESALADVKKLAAETKQELAGLFDAESATKGAKALAQLQSSNEWKSFSKQQRETLTTLLEQSSAIEVQIGHWKALEKAAAEYADIVADERVKYDEETAKNRQSVVELVAELELETKTMMMTNEERERAVTLSKILMRTTEEQVDAEKKVNEAFDRRNSAVALKRSLEEQKAAWEKAYNDISDKLTDALMRGFETGKDAAQNFIDTLRNMFRTLVLRPTIQAIVSPLAAGVTGMLGLPGQAAASGGGGFGAISTLGGLGNMAGLGGSSLLGFGGLSGLFSGAGGMFGAGAIGNSFALGGMGQALGLSAAGLDAAGGVALTTLGTTVGTLLPVIGAGLAVAAMFGAFKSKGGGPKSGGFAQSGMDMQRWFTPSDQDAGLKTATEAVRADYNRLIAALGGRGQAGFALGFDTDPKGSASNRAFTAATVGGKEVYRSWLEDLGRDEAALQAALATESKRALLAALQASDLPQQMSALLGSVTASAATDAEVDQLLTMAQALTALNESARTAAESLAIAQARIVDSLESVGLAMPDNAAGFADLARGLDLSSESGKAALSMLLELAPAFGEVSNAIAGLQTSIQNTLDDLRGVSQAERGQRALGSAITAFAADREWAAALREQLGDLGFAANMVLITAEDLEAYAKNDVAGLALINDILLAYKETLGNTAADMSRSAGEYSDATADVVEAYDWANEIATATAAVLRAQGLEVEALTLERSREMAALAEAPAALRDLTRQLWALEDAAVAAAKAAQIAAAEQDLRARLLAAKQTYAETTGDSWQAEKARTALLALTRAAETKQVTALDKSLQPLLETIYAFEDANYKAAQAAAERESAERAMEAAVAEHERQVEEAKRALMDAYQREAGELRSTIDKFKALAKSLRDFKDELADKILTPSQSYKAALDKLYAAPAEEIVEAGRTFLTAAERNATTSFEYRRDVARTMAIAEKGAEFADEQVTVAEQQLAVMEDQLKALGLLNDNLLSFSDALKAYLGIKDKAVAVPGMVKDGELDAETIAKRAENTATYFRGLVDQWVNDAGATQHFQSQFDALGGAGWDMEKEAAYIASKQQTVIDYMEKWGVGLDELTGGMLDLFNKYGLPEPHALGGTAYGLSLVGEQGPELADFRAPARIYPANQTAAILKGNGETEVLLRQLLAETRAANVAIARNTGRAARILQKFDGDGMPETRVV